MTDLDVEDSLTKLNTQLNKSMVLMDSGMGEEMPQHRSNKSITINTKIQPASLSNSSQTTSRRSILKKSDNRVTNDERNSTEETNNDRNTLNEYISNNSSTPRPHNIDELLQEETLTVDSVESAFSLDDISDSEDIWIMDVPKTIDPQDLTGQQLALGEKSKFKIKGERYCAVNHDVKCNITCVFNTGRNKPRYKTVNIKPVGTITIRKKLASTPKIKPMLMENTGVPFPKNLKTRHPLFGANYEGNVREGAMKELV